MMKEIDECIWCADEGVDVCQAEHPERELLCTRPAGHEGLHMACGTEVHEISSWISEAEKGGE